MSILYDDKGTWKNLWKDHDRNLYKYCSDIPVGKHPAIALPVVWACDRKDLDYEPGYNNRLVSKSKKDAYYKKQSDAQKSYNSMAALTLEDQSMFEPPPGGLQMQMIQEVKQ